jgi:hypothetical protein
MSSACLIMGRRRTSRAVTSFLLVLSTVSLTDAHDDPLNIDWAPAPAPQNGPSFDFHANRNTAMIPIQIGAIVGAYVLTIVVIGICYLTFGRRLRRAAQSPQGPRDVEMVKPVLSKSLGPSPVSPELKKGAWPSPQSANSRNFSYPSPTKSTFTKATVVDFNEEVIEADKEARKREMERYYAAVYDLEDKNKSSVSVNLRNSPSPSHTPSQSIDSITANSRPYAPPNYLQRAPSYHSTVQQAPLRSANTSPAPAVYSPPPHKLTHSRKSSATSLASTNSKRRGIRGLQISNPMPASTNSYLAHQANRSDEEPLTPRYPPPPTPTPPAPRQSPSPKPPTHLPSSPRPTGIDEALHSHRTAPAASSIGNLPLRSPTGPTSVRSYNTRQTEVSIPDRRRPGPAGVGILPGNGTLSPMTATTAILSPMTPYSAYEPQTPRTPFTPRLVTRAERKAKAREEGRGLIKEVVQEEKDMWE